MATRHSANVAAPLLPCFLLKTKNIHFAETNIAQKGVATQSTQVGNDSPDKALDGNHDTNVYHGSCSITTTHKSPWWRLDLLETYQIDVVTVTISEDSHYSKISGAEIRIGNSLQQHGNINPR